MEKREANEANACNARADLTCEYPIKTELWAGDVCVKVWSETEYQRRFRLSNQYKELSEIVRFRYYAEGFGATRDGYERPKPARIKTNKLQEGKATTTWNYSLCQHGITEVPDSTHTILTRPPCGKCAVDVHHRGSIQGAGTSTIKWWVLLATATTTGYQTD